MKKITMYFLSMILLISIFTVSQTNTVGASNQVMSIPLNTTITDKVETEDDTKLYRVNIPQSGYISVEFLHDYIPDTSWSNDYWRVKIYSSHMEEMTYQDLYADEMQTKLIKVGVPKGGYYIAIESRHPNAKYHSYRIKVNFTKSAIWETEPNNSYKTADVMRMNKTIYASIMGSKDYDYYKIKVPNSGYMNLTVLHDYIEPYGFISDCMKVTIYNNQMNKIQEKSLYDIETKAQIKTKVTSGYYYIKVDSDTAKLKYQLKTSYQFYNRNPKITSLKKGKKKVYIRWWKVNNSQGYEIYMSRKKKSGYKKIKTTKALKYTKKGLKKKKYYYFKVRAYKYSNGKKSYTPFSSIKRVKVK